MSDLYTETGPFVPVSERAEDARTHAARIRGLTRDADGRLPGSAGYGTDRQGHYPYDYSKPLSEQPHAVPAHHVRHHRQGHPHPTPSPITPKGHTGARARHR